MDELLALLERYSPGYRDQIKGVADWRIDELQEAFGRPLPRFYRQFCRVMGMNAGPLLAHVNAYEPRDDVATIYRIFPDVELPPRRFLYVFGDPSVDSQHYWLDLEQPAEESVEDCRVVRMSFGREGWEAAVSPVYVSLREALFAWAMTYVHLPTFPHQVGYYLRSGDNGPEAVRDAEELARILERLGFTRLLYPRHCLLFERGDAGILLYQPPASSGLSLEMGVQDSHECRRLEAIIEENTGMTKS
jgi:hypothetical protein